MGKRGMTRGQAGWQRQPHQAQGPCTLDDRGAITLLGDPGSVGDRGSQTWPMGFQKRALSRAQFMGHFVLYLESALFMKVPAICLNFSLRKKWPSPERV